MSFKPVSLDDKYDLSKDRVFISGTQAIIRLALTQKERDRRAGLNTAGYVSGYRGSPLGGLDQQFWRAKQVTQENDVVFQPGVNEDLAATAIWGAQQAELRGDGRFDGVFGIWYGKGPGVDRTGDVFRHANLAGTSPNGGVLALMGDDHTCESSTTAHQSEFALVDAMMPIFNPAGAQEILDYGLYGWALSRYASVWTGLKCIKDTVESTAVVDSAIDRVSIIQPEDFQMPPGGLHIRQFDPPIVQEARLHDFKIPAVMAFLRANKLDKIMGSGGRKPRIGVAAAGKSWLDVTQALDDLGIDEIRAADLGIRLFKVGVPWPLEPEGVRDFAKGLDLIIVVEEKRALIEAQMKEILYGTANVPQIVGKNDEQSARLFQTKASLDSNDVASAIGERVLRFCDDGPLREQVNAVKTAQDNLRKTENVAERIPYFCPGCPHNSSTVVPEGSRAYAGIGCHYMAQWMDRKTEGYTHMGGEGANWVGEAPFSNRQHVFQNIGDGTYNHSGYMAIRAAAKSGVNITYKILYNDAVAMTGGQPHDGGMSVPMVANQMAAEGAKRVVIVTDEPDKYDPGIDWPYGLSIHHRSELQTVQKELSQVKGLSVLIYDQTCAAEKRRRRKRGTFPDPDRRVVINAAVCEGCGDCGDQSNCIAIQPLETEFGRKRRIDQSACNKDFSCLNGFCPSFVTVHGAKIKKSTGGKADRVTADDLPTPDPVALDRPYGMVITGVGGTGVVTIGAIVGMAAHIEGKGCGIIDMAGLAQKGGAVVSHVRVANTPEDIKTIRVPAAGADLILGCDLVVAGSAKVLSSAALGRTKIVVNTHESYPGAFTQDPDFSLPTRRLIKAIGDRADADQSDFVDAQRIATTLLGDSIATNMFMLGYAFQKGGLPLSAVAIEKAIELNAVAVQMNTDAFRWGRRMADDGEAVIARVAALQPSAADDTTPRTLSELIAHRTDQLSAYQNAAYGARFADRVKKIQAAEDALGLEETALTEAVAKGLFKLMAYKDEYEVARLYTDGAFKQQLANTFESWERLEFHMAPPLLASRDSETGHLVKRAFGPWMMKAFGALAKFKRLRGTSLDLFGRSQERRAERQLVNDYEAVIDQITAGLTADNHAKAVALASYPDRIRGFGHVKDRHIVAAIGEKESMLAQFKGGRGLDRAAE